MYMFELLAQYHLPEEDIKKNSEAFMTLFTSSLSDSDVKVKVSALKAITAFLSSIGDEEVLMKYASAMDNILDVVISVLQHDEEQGQASLESIIELTQVHGEIWEKSCGKLIFVMSEVMKANNFEPSTRQSAVEIITTLAEEMASMLRKQTEGIKEHLFPAMFQMIAEPELQDELDEWYEQENVEDIAKNDPSSVAKTALDRIASAIGEKQTLANI